MATATKTGIRHTIERVKQAWLEMDHAQRRLFEIQTGVQAREPHDQRALGELEALYELDGSSVKR